MSTTKEAPLRFNAAIPLLCGHVPIGEARYILESHHGLAEFEKAGIVTILLILDGTTDIKVVRAAPFHVEYDWFVFELEVVG